MSNQLLEYPKEYLNLFFTLTCGQSFRWRQDEEGWWGAPVKGQILRIREEENGFLWQTAPDDGNYELLSECFRLDTDIPQIYRHLESSDEHMALLINRFQGLRILRQDPEETVLSYMCSTANSVPRIMTAIEALSRKYGNLIGKVGGREYFSFPSAEVFAEADLDDLYNTAGLCWRGQNVSYVAKQILDRPSGWLNSLRSKNYKDAKSELVEFRGIGEKIADCVCLFALDKDEAVPVDTHIRQVAVRYYMPDLKTKTITTSAYTKIVSVFQEIFGDYAGWAQEFLFYEDLLRGRKRSTSAEEC